MGGEEVRGGAEQSGRGRLIPHLRDAGHWRLGGGGARSEGSLPGFRPDHPGEPGGVTRMPLGHNEQSLDPLLESPAIMRVSGRTL